MNSYFKNLKKESLVFLFIVSVYLFQLNENISAQTDSEVLTNKLNSFIDSIYIADNVPGIIAGVYTSDFTYNYAIGKADLKKGSDRKYDELIKIGSITKTFTATVLLQLADEGKLNIDDKLNKFFPSYPNSENISIRQMLNMTSGIPDYLDDQVILNSFLNNHTDKYTELDIFYRTINLGPAFPPGEGWLYSNGNYNILGMIIEQITGKTVGNEITSRIIIPLGLKNTYYPIDGNIHGEHGQGYLRDTLTGELHECTFLEPSITGAAGCMISNIPDLKIFCEALIGGTLLSKQMQQERLKFVNTGHDSFLSYGLGILNMSGFLGHNGGIIGFNSSMFYSTELDAMILVSVNEFGTKGGVSDKVFGGLALIMFPDKGLFK